MGRRWQPTETVRPGLVAQVASVIDKLEASAVEPLGSVGVEHAMHENKELHETKTFRARLFPSFGGKK